MAGLEHLVHLQTFINNYKLEFSLHQRRFHQIFMNKLCFNHLSIISIVTVLYIEKSRKKTIL